MARPTATGSLEQTEPPRFSIVIPCYEPEERFLQECVTSVLGQTIDGWEAIVVDDASRHPDVEGLIRRTGDPRIRVIRHTQNRGEASSRNTGIRIARGELIVALDADDRLAPDFLRKAGAALDASPQTDWVLTGRQLFGSSVDVLRYPVPLPPPCPMHFNAQSPGLIRRRLWEDIGGYSEEEVFRSGGADLDFWMSAVEQGVVAGYVAEPLYLWRIHGDSASQNSFRYDNHLIHRALYRRHRRLFRSYADRCPRCRGRRSIGDYLASGYLAAADASLLRGERARGTYLAARALALHPDRRAVRQLAKILAPSSVVSVGRILQAKLSRSRRLGQKVR
jgi:glycosyltransferase involved in cell wall biosynthesis